MNEGGGAAWCHRRNARRGADIAGRGSRSATEGGPETSSLSAVTIINVGPLDSVVVHPYPPYASNRTNPTRRSVRVLVLLSIQERLGRDECWVRSISSVLPQGCNAPVSVLAPVRNWCGSGCVRVRCGKTAISGLLLLRLMLALPPTGHQRLYAGVSVCGPGRFLCSSPAGLDLNRSGPHDKRCSRRRAVVKRS